MSQSMTLKKWLLDRQENGDDGTGYEGDEKVSQSVKECVEPDEMTWEDCDKPGHEEGCHVMVCPGCNTRFPDCED